MHGYGQEPGPDPNHHVPVPIPPGVHGPPHQLGPYLSDDHSLHQPPSNLSSHIPGTPSELSSPTSEWCQLSGGGPDVKPRRGRPPKSTRDDSNVIICRRSCCCNDDDDDYVVDGLREVSEEGECCPLCIDASSTNNELILLQSHMMRPVIDDFGTR